MNKLQIQILEELLGCSEDNIPAYWQLMDWTNQTKEVLKKEITELRKMGYVEHVKGLMTDEGEVAGSGFMIPYQKRKEVEKLINDLG